MNWSSPAQIVAAFFVAGVVVWFSPLLLVPLGLGEFVILGQLCLAVLALSLLDLLFRRVTSDHSDDGGAG